MSYIGCEEEIPRNVSRKLKFLIKRNIIDTIFLMDERVIGFSYL